MANEDKAFSRLLQVTMAVLALAVWMDVRLSRD